MGPAALTNLEGAILSELEHRGCKTAFQVRRAFANSPSLEWRGSAGAVYPAVKRLAAAGLITQQETGEARGTRHLAVTADGREALNAWVADADLATGIGVDPFRLRASFWEALPAREWRRLRTELERALDESDARLTRYLKDAPAVERPGVELALALNATRRAWLAGRGQKPVNP